VETVVEVGEEEDLAVRECIEDGGLVDAVKGARFDVTEAERIWMLGERF